MTITWESQPNLDFSSFCHTPLSPWHQFKTRVNHYDQLASSSKPVFRPSEKSFTDKLQASTLMWGTRTLLGDLGDHYYQLPAPGRLTDLGKSLSSGFADARSYHDWLGVSYEKYDVGPSGQFARYRDFFFTKSGRQAWLHAFRQNFLDFLKPEYRQNFNFKTYLKETVIHRNVNSIVQPLGEGQLFTSVLRFLGLGMLGLSIIKHTKQAYDYAKARENHTSYGRFKTYAYTAAHFVGQSIKTLAGWEIGTIGYILGSALVPIGIASTVTGIVLGGLLGTLAYKLLSKVIPDPPAPIKASI